MEAHNGVQASLKAENNGSYDAFILRDLIVDVPLSAEDPTNASGVYITCADVWEGNLYIGTSAGELLHFVSLPPADDEDNTAPTYILASRLQPSPTGEQEERDKGVKQILILSNPSKACVLCNGTLTFYTLPELSPAFGGKISQRGCTWVGGLDLNESAGNTSGGTSGTVIVICLRQKLRLIRIGEEARKIRDIELGGVQAIHRRGNLACVADGSAYSLLDVLNQQKVDLFPITTTNTASTPKEEEDKALPSLPPTGRPPSRSFSSASPERSGRTHSRNISVGGQPQGSSLLRPDSSSPWPARRSSKHENERQVSSSPRPSASRQESPRKPEPIIEEPQDPPRESSATAPVVVPSKPLLPNIVSPTATEFLLTTGTKLDEPGVGMFVNLEGDLVPRGTVEFSTYPLSIVLQGSSEASSTGASSSSSNYGYILAIVRRRIEDRVELAIEAQRWDSDPSETTSTKCTISLDGALIDPNSKDATVALAGLRPTTTTGQLVLTEVSRSLRLRRLALGRPDSDVPASEHKRNAEEDRFASQFAKVTANVLVYINGKVQWVVRNPLLVQLEGQLRQTTSLTDSGGFSVDVPGVQRVINSIRGQEWQDGLDFLTLTYVRQKASLLMFGDLLVQTSNGVMAFERNKRVAEEALVEGEVDPRTVLRLVPPLAEEVQESADGLWIPQGLRDVVELLAKHVNTTTIVQDAKGAYGDNLLKVLKRYLLVWRKKKGLASIADEAHVFHTVDAALLHVLLMLDENTARGPATAGSVRAELNDVIDRGVDCFERAVALFEQYKRLYLLSRLYQSRKNVAMVLATWKRVLEGERDAGGELIEGELDMRKYLSKLKDASLVKEYGSWLANRNPRLGVQVFADDAAKVKFEPTEAVAILKESAPRAVKDYLEHLVFGKNHVQYVNDLIAFYLDTVLTELEQSEAAKSALLQSYETYRALIPPKPTYRQFVTDNALDEEWWRNRLRLLQLIGGSHGAASKYDAHALREKLAAYSNELVPEMIILNGREGKHEEALRLLTQGLGDYDTAVRYCLLGGSSIFHAGSSMVSHQPLPSKEDQGRLFTFLLHEFLRIEDLSERLERTSELLERFGGWFDVQEVLSLIPEGWSVQLVSGFLVHSFRRLIRERHEAAVVKALTSAQNLRQGAAFAEKSKDVGATYVKEGSELEAGG